MGTTDQRIDIQTAPVPLTLAILWNAVAPVSRLPSEILAYIFLYCACRDYRENWRDAGVPQWVNVSYVCSRWRYVALNRPILWSYLFAASPRWTDELLIRSKEVPLWVRVCSISVTREMMLDFMEQVTPHAERFRECRLDIQSDDADFVLPMLSSRSAPLLHTLAITCKHHPFYWNYEDDADAGFILGAGFDFDVGADAEVDFDVDEDTGDVGPHTFFNGDTPALRELYLNDFLFTWCSPTLGGLTVLRLRDLTYSGRPTIAELRATLSRMPDLAQLDLDNAIRDGPHDPVCLDAEKVHLPRLAHLSIGTPFSTLVRFLSCIDIPVTTRVRLTCCLESRSDENDYALFYAFLSQTFTNSEATSVAPIRTMVMDNALRYMTIIFSRSERKCGRPNCHWSLVKDCDCDVPLKVAIDCPSHAPHWNDLVVGICRSVPLTCLKNLIVENCCLPSELWFDIIWHLQELRYIELIGGDFSDIAILLSLSHRPLPEDADRPRDQRTSQVFVPSLEELCLDVVRMPRCEGTPSMQGSHVMLFRDALVRRRAAGHALERLLIYGGFSLSLEEVISLREVVPQVVVRRFARLSTDDGYCEICEEEASEELGTVGPIVHGSLPDDDSLASITSQS